MGQAGLDGGDAGKRGRAVGTSSIDIRTLFDGEVAAAQELSNRIPDVFTAYLQERLPNFFEISEVVDPPREPRLAVGAYDEGRLVGAASVSVALGPDAWKDVQHDWDAIEERFSNHELGVYFTLLGDWNRALIGAPEGSLFVHSLCVEPSHRGRGVGRRLVAGAIERLETAERGTLFMEVARRRGWRRFCEPLGFRAMRRTLSLSDRLQFGCWGVVLLKYESGDAARVFRAG